MVLAVRIVRVDFDIFPTLSASEFEFVVLCGIGDCYGIFRVADFGHFNELSPVAEVADDEYCRRVFRHDNIICQSYLRGADNLFDVAACKFRCGAFVIGERSHDDDLRANCGNFL